MAVRRCGQRAQAGVTQSAPALDLSTCGYDICLQYATSWAAGWCEYVRLNRVRVEPFASVVPHLLLGMPWGATISPKVPKSR